jgi:hypothetical protein
MRDIETNATMQCLCRREALDDRGAITQVDELVTFRRDRAEIEEVASDKYDAGNIELDGSVTVSSLDLNPQLYATSG